MDTIDKILCLMSERGITAAQLTREAGITNGLITQWKQRKQQPSRDNVAKIAAYFNVSTDYLMGVEKSATPEGERPVDEKRAMLIYKIRAMSDEDFDKTLEYVEMMELAKKAKSKQNR